MLTLCNTTQIASKEQFPCRYHRTFVSCCIYLRSCIIVRVVIVSFCFCRNELLILRLWYLCLKFSPCILKLFRRALLLIFELQALCSTHCVGKFVCFISASNVTYNGPLVLSIKPKAKEAFCTAIILVFFIQRKCSLNKSYIHFQDLLPYLI